MRSKSLIILLSFFYLSAISQNIKKDDCQLYFKEIGIRDFSPPITMVFPTQSY